METSFRIRSTATSSIADQFQIRHTNDITRHFTIASSKRCSTAFQQYRNRFGHLIGTQNNQNSSEHRWHATGPPLRRARLIRTKFTVYTLQILAIFLDQMASARKTNESIFVGRFVHLAFYRMAWPLVSTVRWHLAKCVLLSVSDWIRISFSQSQGTMLTCLRMKCFELKVIAFSKASDFCWLFFDLL